VTKFRGAGQGVLALVAEVVVGELARHLGLAVPELVTVEIDPQLGAAEPDPEIQDLIAASPGLNLGVDFLPGALPYAPGAWVPAAELAAAVVWLDALVMNVDRTARNPNMLLWHGQLWLIDHGAALYLQHGAPLRAELAGHAFPLIGEHVLLAVAGSILDAHERLSALIDLVTLSEILARVPPGWLDPGSAPGYVEFLAARLDAAAFAQEAERARAAA
jgi:hypothetical protein